MSKQGYVYILTNQYRTTLYIGVTSNIVSRIYQHKHNLVDGFSKKYNLHTLVYYEAFDSITMAIEREKQLKSGSRKSKVELIQKLNPEWKDLYASIV